MAKKSPKRSRSNARDRQPAPPIADAGRRRTMTIGLAVLGAITIGCIWLIYVVVNQDDTPPRSLTSSRSQSTTQMDNSGQSAQGSDVEPQAKRSADGRILYGSPEKPRYVRDGNLTMVWDSIRPDILRNVHASTSSNIAARDYVGPGKCVECHAQNHADWSKHPHRWMNAMAEDATVLGDFSGKASIDYRGGKASFYRDGSDYKMDYAQGDLQRSYVVTQTIGSRFYQYYIGKGLSGPEPAGHNYYSKDHVLPFGYWLEREAWVPIVHVAAELSEEQRWESAETIKMPRVHGPRGDVGAARGVSDGTIDPTLTYAHSCNFCHTTFPLGDLFVRLPQRFAPSVPTKTFFAVSQHTAESHPEIWDGSDAPEYASGAEIEALTGEFIAFEAPHKAATLGVSCEACHLGCREHVETPEIKPAMVPRSPHLLSYDDPAQVSSGLAADNINTACGRCHSGARPKFAGGMSTWNSTEHTDAMAGSCYSEMSCVNCHDPHKAIGPVWNKTPAEDDASCLKCHQEFLEPAPRLAHTHHAAGTAGDHCMDCHMPRINEGMQDVVRTHTIFSPTQADMLHANQPNACNLCHLEKPIAWTLKSLKDWYGKSYSAADIARNYPNASQPVGLGWLASPHESTRLVASEAAARQKAGWMMPALVTQLDDPFLLNRQFAQTSLESLLGDSLDKRFGYWFYMTPSERKPHIQQIRDAINATTAP